MTELDERKAAVLRAIVEQYVDTAQPVGSQTVTSTTGLGVSAATVRNEMAALEQEGFLVQPHTSAGRIPTDKGYRLFVDRLSQLRSLTLAERRAISTFLDGAVDLDDVMQRAVRLLAQLNRQVALIQYPSLTRSSVRSPSISARFWVTPSMRRAVSKCGLSSRAQAPAGLQAGSSNTLGRGRIKVSA